MIAGEAVIRKAGGLLRCIDLAQAGLVSTHAPCAPLAEAHADDMTPYLVRLNAAQLHAHEIVGIFVASSMTQLFWMVDEAASPLECECIELPAGGIYWESFTDHQVPRRKEPDWERLPDGWSPLPAGAGLTEGWDEMLSADTEIDEEEWFPLEWIEDKDQAVEPPGMMPTLPPRRRRRRRR